MSNEHSIGVRKVATLEVPRVGQVEPGPDPSLPWQVVDARGIEARRRRPGSPEPGSVNQPTGKRYLGSGYAPATINHNLAVVGGFYRRAHLSAGGGHGRLRKAGEHPGPREPGRAGPPAAGRAPKTPTNARCDARRPTSCWAGWSAGRRRPGSSAGSPAAASRWAPPGSLHRRRPCRPAPRSPPRSRAGRWSWA
jgi:hypothetical protein